ncbi:hypothetical protein [Actinoplanes sp. N902-109]|uniref:hypothetical protein n=1 Tax=Actinoplanes sp. (strain N902-109) TaxID=649831 RepID=UPI0003294979|nr:hypothetical protein [Actinoplanes sp. N902-109]AGL18013.1 hypothetical protein L083_4503 [Actinoplanes sp. N902-109]
MRHRIGKLVAAAGLGIGGATLVAGTALASGPVYDAVANAYSGSTWTGSSHIALVSSPDKYDIAVADKASDGKTVCVRIYPDSGGSINYCDNNGTSAAQHYTIYYDWYAADLTVGGAVIVPAA